MQNQPGYSRFLVTMASLTLLLVTSISHAADPERRESKRRLEGPLQLMPHPNAEVILPDFRAIQMSDGSVNLRGGGAAKVGDKIQGIDIEVDLENRTYVTRRLSKTEIQERLKDSPSHERLQKSSSQARRSTEAYYAPGSYRVAVLVQAYDPVGVVLTETATLLEWDVSATGQMIYRYGGDYCWADEDTAFETSWYVDHCVYNDLWWSTGMLCNDVEGWYHNWDYLWDDQITTAHQYAQLCGRSDGGYYYDFFHKDSGEDADPWVNFSVYHYYY